MAWHTAGGVEFQILSGVASIHGVCLLGGGETRCWVINSLDPKTYIVWQLVCQCLHTSLLLIIRLSSTCGERKIWGNIKKSQNIATIIVVYCLFFVIFIDNTIFKGELAINFL